MEISFRVPEEIIDRCKRLYESLMNFFVSRDFDILGFVPKFLYYSSYFERNSGLVFPDKQMDFERVFF